MNVPGTAADTTPPLSQLASNLKGSEILQIANDIRAKLARGETVTNLTIGDFRPDQFPIPEMLKREVVAAIEDDQTNYPPPNGLPELREAIVGFYRRYLELDYQPSNVVVTGGVRPTLYSACRAVLDPGDVFVYPVPSWNTNHYATIMKARSVPIETGPESHFLATADDLEDHLAEARLLLLNSPSNPCGTAYSAGEMERIAAAVLAENDRRAARNKPALYILYDQVYWRLTFGEIRHVTPVHAEPRLREYTIFADGISKVFAATGLRVGWCVAPERILTPLNALTGHIGAWAPRPEQRAASRFLARPDQIDQYQTRMIEGLETRLRALYDGLMKMREEGYPVDAIPPMGALYLSTRFNLVGRTAGGRKLTTNEDVRRFLLDEAAVAVVPFGAFGLPGENGWFRLSVGALALNEVEPMFASLRQALDRVS